MIAAFCVGYGLLSGVIFFAYLCWFMHVRDNVEGRGKRFLYYFLIAITFGLVGSVTGVSAVLGVISILILLSFLPKGQIGNVVAFSVVFGVLSGAAIHGDVAAMMRRSDRGSPQRSMERGGLDDRQASSSSAPRFDPDKYFFFDGVDPTMEFGDPIEITADNVKILLPVPSGYTYTEEDDELTTGFLFFNDNSKTLRMDIGIPKKMSSIMHYSDNDATLNLRRKKMDVRNAVFENSDKYIDKRTSGLLEQGVTFTRRISPTIEQNTRNSIVAFFSCYCSRKDKEFTASNMEVFLVIDNQCMGMTIVLISKNHEDDKRFGFTWLKEFMAINGVKDN